MNKHEGGVVSRKKVPQHKKQTPDNAAEKLQEIEIRLYELRRSRQAISEEIRQLEEEYRKLGGVLETRY